MGFMGLCYFFLGFWIMLLFMGFYGYMGWGKVSIRQSGRASRGTWRCIHS